MPRKANQPKEGHMEPIPSLGEDSTLLEYAEINKRLYEIDKKLCSVVTVPMLDNLIKESFRKLSDEIIASVKSEIKGELTGEIKEIQDKMDGYRTEIDSLKSENVFLKDHTLALEAQILEAKQLARSAIIVGNRNEQYSRKKNIKLMGLKEEEGEDLKAKFREIIKKHVKIDVDFSEIVAIHRIPQKSRNFPRPVLIKFVRSDIRTEIMRKRQEFKKSKLDLYDDVCRRNVELINRLKNHPKIESSWYFNNKVYGKTTSNVKIVFDLYDDINAKTNGR